MDNLQQFVHELDRRGQLTHIRCEVDSDQELAEIHRRVIAANGPALLFHRVKGSPFPVVSNLFGTTERVALAFGEEPKRFLEEAVAVAQTLFPLNSEKVLRAAKLVPRLLRTGLKQKSLKKARIKSGRLLPLDLNQLPLTKSWEEDGGHFLTLPLVYTESPEGKGHNLGMYRMQRYDHMRMGMHWQIGKGGGFHYGVAEKSGKALPVSVHLGGPPSLILSAIAPLPENVGELLLASFLLGKRLQLTRMQEHPISVVANAEFALLGEVLPDERFPEGPFGDHYGYYSLKHDYPVFRCREIWHAENAIFPVTVVGKPRQEDYYIGEYLQDLLKPLFPMVMPGVIDLWSYGETGFHSLASAIVKERYARESMVTAFRLLGEGQLALTKVLLLLDESVEHKLSLSNFSEVLPHILERCDFNKDLYIFNHLSMDTLDYTGPEVNKGSKMVLLGTGEPMRTLPGEFQGPLPSLLSKARAFCKGCLVVQGGAFEIQKNLAHEIARLEAFKSWPLIILVDDLERALTNEASFLWTTFTRFEPAGDLFASKETKARHHIAYDPPIVIDARMKPNYPKELFCSENISRLVSRRWEEYFPKGMTQGSSDYANVG